MNSISIFDKKKPLVRLSKTKVEQLYSKIEDYFENCEKYGLKYRDGQFNMALSILDTIESLDHLIIEAGVGIGKSYAYLIPFLYYYQLTKKSFILSTSTIALQEQLENDLKKLSEQLNIPIDIVVAKGMTNFLCLQRLRGYLGRNKNSLIKEHDYKKEQDRKYYPEIKDNEWKEVCVQDCKYGQCKSCMNCQFYKTRDKMKRISGAIICNHDLVIEDLDRKTSYSPKDLLKSVDYVVFDEAHNLESKIRNQKTKEVKLFYGTRFVKEAISILAKNHNYDYDYTKFNNSLKKLNKRLEENINEKLSELIKQGIDIEDINGLDLVIDNEVKILSTKIMNFIISISNSLYALPTKRELGLLQDDLDDYVEIFDKLSKGNEGDMLFWVERKGKKNNIFYAPKKINMVSYKLFFDNERLREYQKDYQKTFIFTSATLSTNNEDYSYFMSNIGADLVDKGIDIAESYESPYDYENNTLLYCCGDIASPKNKDKYLDDLVNKIKELIKLTNGKTLVLFTSKSDMNYVYKQIGDKFDDINIYIQRDGSSQDEIKEKFRNDINSVLFSTGIFWEGIDIKGESLSSLIIARLPFPVVDPIMEYKKDLYGADGFNKVYIPEMLIKLKQGIGRLIRSETDKGIVSILDSRLNTNKNYQDLVKETIPIKNFVYNIKDVEKFVKDNKIDN